jgi:hypothetical protein
MAVGGMFSMIDSKTEKAKIDSIIAKLQKDVVRVFAGIVEEAFVQLVQETPQWSGFLAASWNMTVNRASRQTANKGDYPDTDNPYQKGLDPAVRDALSRAEGKTLFQSRFQAHGWVITVNNNVDYAEDVNNGSIKLRTKVGHSPGFFDAFVYRVQNAHAYMNDGTWDFYANTNFLGEGYR